ncbi:MULTISPECIES: helix-turn-helix domain-containing protein [Thermocrispum]|jgi:DNA-binding HxlR family transcriptional regulator|uniref:Helix-turn-helix domain-containing protein n=1 Tax=Thermocrispum agreste TaxID=37925 RepID=A0A2W4JC78_9PSEU|nr:MULTISPECIES: helix-turn-helix domain-containing protein [Thermocrispum]PZM96694.1 MAG: transcriptional regulator [Thermocrispum agreste]
MSEDSAQAPSEGVLQRLGEFAARDRWPAKGWCRIERALEVIGTRSAMLVLRELFYGGTRFDEFTRRTGLSEAVVAGRLKQLHADGIVERRPYREAGKRTRDEYVLTERGRQLFPILVALMQWGETLRDDHRTGVELIHRDCEAPLTVQVRCTDGHRVPLEQGAVRIKDEDYVKSALGRK